MKNLLFSLLLVSFSMAGTRKSVGINSDGKALAGSAQTLPATGKIYVGAAFNMIDMTKPSAAGWSEISNRGVGLHVHPVGWRGKWDSLGPGIAANLKNKTFTYEYDIIDLRNKVDNIGEIKRVESYGLKCVRALCNLASRWIFYFHLFLHRLTGFSVERATFSV